MGTIGAKYLKKRGILKNLDETEEINACTVKVKAMSTARTRTGCSCSRTRPTTTRPRSSRSAAPPPASAALSATRCPAAATCTRPCASPARATRRPGFRDPARQAAAAQARDHRCRRLFQLRQPDRPCHRPGGELYHPGYVAKRMEVGAVVGATPGKQRPPRSAPPPATRSSCWAAAPAATASAARPAPPRPTP